MNRMEFVEKALIGSLLNDSTRRSEVPWVRAQDFTNPLCRALWCHLESGNPPTCRPLVDLVEMSQVLGRGSELHPRLRSPADLATLQVQAPEKPAVIEYGRILVEATIRREVAAMGLRLEFLARGEPELIIDGIASALASLEGLDQRWQVSMDRRKEVDPDLSAASLPVCAAGASLPANHDAGTFAVGTDMDQQLAARAVIGAAVHDWPPGARARVLKIVRRSDFTDARAIATWQAVEYLAEHDTPIDEITVAWQIARAHGQSGDGLTVPELRETRDAALFHEVGAATLAKSTLIRVASRARAATTRYTDDLSVDLATVIDSLATHHVAVAATAQRLTSEPLSNESLVAIKNRLAQAGRSKTPVTASARPQPLPHSVTVLSRASIST